MSEKLIFNTVVAGMFVIIMTLAGLLWNSLGARNAALQMSIEVELHRIDRLADRINEMSGRLAVVEFQLEETRGRQ